MEKNLLPIGVANSRPNHDISSYGYRDTLFSNCYFEVYQDSQTETQKVFCVKRPGIAPNATTIGGSFLGGGIGLGCYTAQPYAVYSKTGVGTNIFFAVAAGSNAEICHHNGSDSVVKLTIPMSVFKRVNFTNIGLPDDTYTTACTAGATLGLFKDRSAVTSLQPTGSATSDLTRAVYLNNRVFVGDRQTGQIWQSSLGTYTTYSASEFITAEAYGGMLVDLCRFNNYIVAFKEYSTEFFEDVANQNGSVLGRVGQAVQQIGCVHPNTIVDTGNGELIWLGMDEGGNRSVVRLSNSFNLEPIQDTLVAKTLNLTSNYDGSYAFLLNANGKQFYVLTLKASYLDSTNALDLANVTFVYDLQTKLWTHWNTAGEANAFVSGTTTYYPLGRWNVTGACRNSFNTTLVQDYDTGALYQLDDFYKVDYSGANLKSIAVTMRIANVDLGTFKRKFINRVTIYSDAFGETQTFFVSLTRSDLTGTTSYRTTTAYPNSSYAWGSYKRFTIDVVHTAATSMRVSAINLDYDIGEGHGIS